VTPPALGTTIILAAAGFAAGVLNALAGGGSFLSFPALILAGVPPLQANATNTAALWPGSALALHGFRNQFAGRSAALQGLGPLQSLWFAAASVFGGCVGVAALFALPASAFSRLVPYLMLLALLIYTFGDRMAANFRRDAPVREDGSGAVWLYGLQVLASIYGGFFGAGFGIVVLALLSAFGVSEPRAANALKLLGDVSVNGVSLLLFWALGWVDWQVAVILAAGCLGGGYVGGRIGQRISKVQLKALVITIGFALTAYFFFCSVT